ncbi:hypothetical protein CEXT_737591 [Caerostris extrusa]|uniref:Uncharacterized protein n=1 Tax=Caerostris extrusa TaxID=172846 RepID=A0AAV4P5S6_CAEEX|nr:hypothetical protein CEXT_737591 [Caerostris extrusa]
MYRVVGYVVHFDCTEFAVDLLLQWQLTFSGISVVKMGSGFCRESDNPVKAILLFPCSLQSRELPFHYQGTSEFCLILKMPPEEFNQYHFLCRTDGEDTFLECN